MKRVNAEKVFLIGAMVCGLATFATADVVAYWPFGTNGLSDASGNGHSLVKSEAGVILTNGFVRLDGSQSAFNSEQTLDLSSCTNLTVEFWMRATLSASSANLIEHTPDFNGNPGAFVAYTDSANPGQVTGGFRTDGYNLDMTAVGSADDGQWHHFAIVYDATQPGAARSRLYFDGLYQPTSGWHLNDGAVSLLNATLYIGSRANTGSKFVGDLDDIRISNAALNASEFLQIPPDADQRVIAYWPFTQGSELRDASRNGHTLTMMYANQVGFRDGQALFKGTSGLYTVDALDLSAYSAITFECFVKSDIPNASPLLAELSGDFNGSPGTFAVSTGMHTNDTMGAGYKTGSGYNIEVAAEGAITDGQWHHIAYVVDLNAPDAADRSQLYLDGMRQTKSPWYNNGETTPFASIHALHLGWRSISPDFNFIGEMDDVRVTGTALTTNEFLTARTATITTNAVVAYWPFDISDGMADASGNGHTLAGSNVAFVNGEAIFNGSQTLSTAATLDLSAYSAITVEYFIKTISTDLSLILEHSPNYNDYPGTFATYMGDSGPGRLTGLFRTMTGHNGDMTGAGALLDGHWHHVALVVDRSQPGFGRAQLYFDYVNQPALYGNDSDVLFANATLFFGSRNNTNLPFVGSLDDVKITAKALSVAEFQRRPTTTLPLVVAYWPFTPGQELADASGNNYALTNSGVAFDSRASAVFSGTQGALSTSNALDLSWYDALTVECFAKSATLEKAVLVESTPLDSAGAFSLIVNSEGAAESLFTAAVYSYFWGWALRYNVDRSAAAVTDGAWHHLAMVIDSAQPGPDRAKLYLDGVLQSVATQHTSDLATRFLSSPLFIGSRAGSTYKFTGELDDIRISAAALTPAQFLARRSRQQGTVINIR